MIVHQPRRPTLLESAAQRAVLSLLQHMKHGQLAVYLPDATERSFGAGSELRASLAVRDPHCFLRLARDGDLGLAESYISEECDSENLTGLLRLFIENEEFLAARYASLARWGRLLNRALHLTRGNDRRGSRKNIAAHYDLSNELFASFLDESMTYSCALFPTGAEPLDEAQRAKRLAVLAKARLGPGQHLLEIGSGWGSFAIDAARETGCRVTTITLSKEQQSLARERVREAGLAGQVAVELCDYRDVRGRFDRVVSIEMIEAVGHRYLGRFFKTIDELLAPDGLAVVQAITIPEPRYAAYRKGCDFIQKHIFPGAEIPSVTAIADALAANSRLFIEDLENIGVHYVRTLQEWRNRFRAARARLEGLGFDRRFQRAWEYYLAYSEAGFATRTLGDVQLVLTRQNNKSLPLPPVSAPC